MRFKLVLEVNSAAFGSQLPINYQYEQSAAIYRILSRGNEDYAAWLHNNGFQLENGKRFKLFTFSRFKIEKRQIISNEERIKILCDEVEWQISFLPEESTEKFIQGLFANQVFEIGDKHSVVQFKIKSIELLPAPDYKETMEFTTMSPICLRMRDEQGKRVYISPAHPNAKSAILIGLMNKYKAQYGRPYIGSLDFDFCVDGEMKSVLTTIKVNTAQQTRVKGFMCSFMMKAPEALMRIMYEGGCGEECAQGFGCVRVK